MNDVIIGWLGAFFLLVLLAMRPQQIRCPVGSAVEGVGQGGARSRGATHCVAVPATRCDDTQEPPNGRRCDEKLFNRWALPIQIYCTGGTRPIVVDERTVGCQR